MMNVLTDFMDWFKDWFMDIALIVLNIILMPVHLFTANISHLAQVQTSPFTPIIALFVLISLWFGLRLYAEFDEFLDLMSG